RHGSPHRAALIFGDSGGVADPGAAALPLPALLPLPAATVAPPLPAADPAGALPLPALPTAPCGASLFPQATTAAITQIHRMGRSMREMPRRSRHFWSRSLYDAACASSRLPSPSSRAVAATHRLRLRRSSCPTAAGPASTP